MEKKSDLYGDLYGDLIKNISQMYELFEDWETSIVSATDSEANAEKTGSWEEVSPKILVAAKTAYDLMEFFSLNWKKLCFKSSAAEARALQEIALKDGDSMKVWEVIVHIDRSSRAIWEWHARINELKSDRCAAFGLSPLEILAHSSRDAWKKAEKAWCELFVSKTGKETYQFSEEELSWMKNNKKELPFAFRFSTATRRP
jgi:hypothetical protein